MNKSKLGTILGVLLLFLVVTGLQAATGTVNSNSYKKQHMTKHHSKNIGETDHENQVFFSFFDSDGNPVPIENTSATISMGTSGITDDQNPDSHQPSWHHHGNNTIYLEWDVGRHKSEDASNSYATELTSSVSGAVTPPVLGLELAPQTESQDNSYFPKELNLWMAFSITNINLGTGSTGGQRTLSIQNLVTAQGSQGPTIAKVLNVVTSLANTAFDAAETGGDILEDDPLLAFKDGLKTLNDEAKDVSGITQLWQNNWYIGQSQKGIQIVTSNGGDDDIIPDIFIAPSPALPSSFTEAASALTVTGVIKEAGKIDIIFPVVISPGSGDHSFNVFVKSASSTGNLKIHHGHL